MLKPTAKLAGSMAANTENRSIGRSHRRVLELLAKTPLGRADARFISQFAIELLELAGAGLVDVRAETVREDGQTIKSARVRITAAGRRVLNR